MEENETAMKRYALPNLSDLPESYASNTRPIEDAEKAKRRSAVETANGDQRGSGIHVTPLLHGLQERFIAGELTTEEAVAELKKHYGFNC